jgi:hypothetical protein
MKSALEKRQWTGMNAHVSRFLFSNDTLGREVGSQVAAYPKLACKAFRCDAYQDLLFLDLPGCLDPRKFLWTAQLVCFVCCAFLDFCPPSPCSIKGWDAIGISREG